MVSDDVGLLCGIDLKFIPSITRFAIHGKRSSENQNPVFRRPLFYWAYLGAAKMPVRFSRNNTVNPVR